MRARARLVQDWCVSYTGGLAGLVVLHMGEDGGVCIGWERSCWFRCMGGSRTHAEFRVAGVLTRRFQFADLLNRVTKVCTVSATVASKPS